MDLFSSTLEVGSKVSTLALALKMMNPRKPEMKATLRATLRPTLKLMPPMPHNSSGTVSVSVD